MTSVKKSHWICAAHRLPNHDGKCRNLHGHNYKITYHLHGKVEQTPDSPRAGMLVDFGQIKREVMSHVELMLDHKTVLHEKDTLVGILTAAGQDVIPMKGMPTAENMAKLIYYWVRGILAECKLDERVSIAYIEVEETEGASARYYSE